MNTLHFCLLSLLLVQSLASVDELWHQWKRAYNKEYNDADEAHRQAIWKRNVDRINAHNRRHDLGLVTYTLGLNRFSDMTFDEFKAKYLSKLPVNSDMKAHGTPYETDNSPVPTSMDWRSAGYVTKVRDQGGCGSCWAFSAAGAVEGQYMKKFGQLKSFSEQQLVDCSIAFNNQGCYGGLMEYAYEYLKVYGLEEERDYPYRARNGYCAFNPDKAVVRVSGYRTVHTGDENQLKTLVGKLGPTSVGIDAEEDFVHYKSGVFVSDECTPYGLNHGVLAVGYGSENGTDYWIVKNSWGDDWGDNGYIRMARNFNNMCGIATLASLPVVIKDH